MIRAEHSQRGAVALISTSGYDVISSPVINTASYLSSTGYAVDLFVVQHSMFEPPAFSQSSIRTVAYKPRWLRHASIVHDLEALLYFVQQSATQYDFLVGFDPGGLRYAAVLGWMWRRPYVYHSLELNVLEESASWREWAAKQVEVVLSQQAIFTLTQHVLRAAVLAKENHLDPDRILLAYNSPIGPPCVAKDAWLREMFGIGPDKIIVLAVGSLIAEHSILELAQAALHWPDNYVLVVHGWFADPTYERQVRALASVRSDHIHISTQLLSPPDKYRVFQSADIGLVFFTPVNVNMRLGGVSAGKLFDFARCGVPVIASDLPGMRELVQDRGWGVVVPTPAEIETVLDQLMTSYDSHSASAVETYEEYEFSKSYAGILERIERTLYGDHYLAARERQTGTER